MRSLTLVLFGFAGANFLGDDTTCSTSSCDDGIECCQVSDTKLECCTHGSCIPHVGCRCREGELCDEDATCPTSGKCDDGSPCCQVDETRFECCTEGSCIPHVGCRCREGELCEDATSV